MAEHHEGVRGNVILEALSKVMTEIEGVPKDGKNAFHGYSFVSEAGLVEAVRPVLLRHGLFIMGPQIREFLGTDSQGVTTFIVEYQLAHISGILWPEKFSVLAQGCDRDSKGNWGDKGAYKAHTGAHKYLLLRLLNLVTGLEPEHDSPGQQTSREDAPARRKPSTGGTASSGPRDGEAKAASGINADVARDAGIYRDAFVAAEKVFGKDAVKKDQSRRFAPVDYAVERMGFRRLSEVPATRENLRRIKALISEYGKGEDAPPEDGDNPDAGEDAGVDY